MSGISQADAQAILDKLIEVQKCDPIGALGSVSVGGRTITYKNAEDLIRMINYWSGVVAGAQRAAAGKPRLGFAVSDFRGCR